MLRNSSKCHLCTNLFNPPNSLRMWGQFWTHFINEEVGYTERLGNLSKVGQLAEMGEGWDSNTAV